MQNAKHKSVILSGTRLSSRATTGSRGISRIYRAFRMIGRFLAALGMTSCAGREIYPLYMRKILCYFKENKEGFL